MPLLQPFSSFGEMVDTCGESHHHPPALFSLSLVFFLLFELAFVVLVLLVEQHLLMINCLLFSHIRAMVSPTLVPFTNR